MVANTETPLPLISIGMPAYKAKYLNDAINSILAQTYQNFELIIVNDASPEDLYSIVKSYNDQRIIYKENKENIGRTNLIENWNLCLSYASGLFLVLASDDDIYEPKFLETMYNLSLKYPNVDLFHSRIDIINDSNDILAVSNPCLEYESDLEFVSQRLISRRTQVAPDFMCRMNALRAIGGFVNFPLAWYSDDATWYSLAKNKGVAYSSEVLFHWRDSGINISSRKDNVIQKLEASFLYKKWIRDYLDCILVSDKYGEFRKKYLSNNFEISIDDLTSMDLAEAKIIHCFKIYCSKCRKMLSSKVLLKTIMFKMLRLFK